jgi:hypothetical protein
MYSTYYIDILSKYRIKGVWNVVVTVFNAGLSDLNLHIWIRLQRIHNYEDRCPKQFA